MFCGEIKVSEVDVSGSKGGSLGVQSNHDRQSNPAAFPYKACTLVCVIKR
jgi:hypothetical protein